MPRTTHKVFWLIFIPYLVLITSGFAFFTYIQYHNDLKIIEKNEQIQLELVRKTLIHDLKNILPDLGILVNNHNLQQFIKTPSNNLKQLIKREFASFSKYKRIYGQIRYINNNGMEVVRINHQNDKTTIIPANLLQNKQQRYYFRNSIGLRRGELYISPLDLNIENRQIERPYVPTIRFSMPVYDEQNNNHGIIVLNYYAENLLQHFDEMLAGSYGHISFLNRDSYWLHSHKAEREWAFMLDKDIRFNLQHPTAWSLISSRNKGQTLLQDGLFTFTSIYPLKLIGGYSKSEVNQQALPHHHIDPESYVWKIVSDVPTTTLDQNFYDELFGLPGSSWLILTIAGLFTSRQLTVNIIERKNLRDQIELHAEIYNTSTEGIFITDTQTNIIDVNAAFCEVSGYAANEIIGHPPSLFSSGHHDKSFYLEMYRKLDTDGYWEGEIDNRHKDGHIYTIWLRISAICNHNGILSNYIALASDITHKKSAEQQLLKYAHHDSLTGAYNRLSFDEQLKHELALARRNNTKVALLYFDLDNFKPVNDTYGHQAGDIILQTIVDRINHNMRATDMLARLGGDEFAVLLPEIDNRETAEKFALSLKLLINQPILYQEEQFIINASIGIALYPQDAENESELINIADQNMYKAKHQS